MVAYHCVEKSNLIAARRFLAPSTASTGSTTPVSANTPCIEWRVLPACPDPGPHKAHAFALLE